MDTEREEKNILEGFYISVTLKGIISFGEIVAGTAIFLIPVALFTHALASFAQEEVLADSRIFIAVYLLIRGFIKLALIICLLKNQLWAYPWSLAVMGALVVYQLYQIAIGHSWIIVALTVFDLIVIYFIWREYVIVKKHLAERVLNKSQKSL